MEWIVNRDIPFKNIEGKSILVAGANSFLASYMIESMLYYNKFKAKKCCNIVGIVRNMEKAKRRFEDYKDRKDLILEKGDICYLKKHEKFDYIIHAASQASPKYYGTDPVGTFLPNVIGTYNLLELARKKKSTNFLFFSSGEIYGEPREYKKSLDEKSYGYLDSMSVRSCYAEGKRAGETLCKSYFEQYGINIKVVRPFHTYGPNMPLDDGRVFVDFVKNVINHENILMRSDGTAIRAFCYIRDAIDGFFRVLFMGKPGEAYNIATDVDVISIKALAHVIAGIFPDKKISVIYSNKANNIGYLKSPVLETRPDITKARMLGFCPEVRVLDGFKRTILSYLKGDNRK